MFKILGRVEAEWPSVKMLMEVREQRISEERVENLIGRLRNGEVD